MIELYQFDFSPFCIKVRGILNFKALEYRTVEILPLLTQYRVRRISGQSMVPVLCDGGATIVDSTEIALYLESVYPSPATIPSAPRARRQVLLWEDWADEVFSHFIRPIALESVVRDPKLGAEHLPPYGNLALDMLVPRLTPVIATMLVRHYGVGGLAHTFGPRLARAMEMLVEATSTDSYLVGESMTLADIAVASAAKPLDMVPHIRQELAYADFFQWRDRILAEVFIH